MLEEEEEERADSVDDGTRREDVDDGTRGAAVGKDTASVSDRGGGSTEATAIPAKEGDGTREEVGDRAVDVFDDERGERGEVKEGAVMVGVERRAAPPPGDEGLG